MVLFLNYQSNLSTFDFEVAKSDVSIPVAFFKSDFVAQWDKSNSTLTLPSKGFSLRKYHSFILNIFHQWNC